MNSGLISSIDLHRNDHTLIYIENRKNGVANQSQSTQMVGKTVQNVKSSVSNLDKFIYNRLIVEHLKHAMIADFKLRKPVFVSLL